MQKLHPKLAPESGRRAKLLGCANDRVSYKHIFIELLIPLVAGAAVVVALAGILFVLALILLVVAVLMFHEVF